MIRKPVMNRRFGIEIECIVPSVRQLEVELRSSGIEVLYAGYTHRRMDEWKLVTDSSLSVGGMIGHWETIEVVSPPLKGEEGLAQLKTVCDVLARVGAKVNRSCGLHVHCDAASLRTEDIVRLYKLYGRYESTIDSMLPPTRRGSGNSFCRSIVDAASRMYGVTTWRDISRLLYGSRYHKVNIESFVRHGTVEFRQHSGTVEYEKIANWVCFVQALVKKSQDRETGMGTGYGLSGLLSDLSGMLEMETIRYIRARVDHFTRENDTAVNGRDE